MLCDGDQLVDVLRQGQGVLNVLPLAGVKDDIDAQLVPLGRRGRRRSRLAAPGDMSLERSPLDEVHRAAGARMVPFGGWDMPLEYPTGTIAEHLACREATPSCSTCPTSARCGSAVPSALDRLQRALSNDLGKIAPGRAQYTHLLDDADGSVLDDIIVWWHPRRRRRRRRLRRDAQRLQHRSRARRRRRRRDDPRAGRARRPGPGARSSGWRTVFPDAAAVGRFRVAHAVVERRRLHGRRHRLHGRAGRRDRRPGGGGRATCGRPSSAPASAGRARRPRHAAAGGRAAAARPRARPGHHAAAGRAGLGRGVGQAGVPRPRRAGRRARAPASRRHLVGIATEGRRPPRAECAVLVDGDVVGEVTSGNFSPVLGHGIAPRLRPAGGRRGRRR